MFWQRGYSGTSTRALTSAMTVSTSSLYAAFGGKAELFELTVRTYAERYREIYAAAIDLAEISAVIDAILTESVLEFTQPLATHPGCLASSAAVSDCPETMNTSAFLADLHATNERTLRHRIQKAIDLGELTDDTDPHTTASLVQTVWHGLSARANLGDDRATLLGIADRAITTVTASLPYR